MKTTVRVVAVTMALLMVTLLFAACGNTLSGEYTKKGLIENTTLKFSGSNVTITCGDVELKGTYEIEDDKITIEIPESEDDAALDTVVKTFLNELLGEQSFEKTDDGIEIGGVEYTKK